MIKVYQKFGLDFSAGVGVASIKPAFKNESYLTAGVIRYFSYF